MIMLRFVHAVKNPNKYAAIVSQLQKDMFNVPHL